MTRRRIFFAAITLVIALLAINALAYHIYHRMIAGERGKDMAASPERDARAQSINLIKRFFVEKPNGNLRSNLHPNIMRDVTFSLKPALLKKRVFFLGGSCVYGFGIPENETVPAQLQKRVGASYEVINAGVCGVDTELLVKLAGEIAAYNPHLVIIYAGHNDAKRGSAGQLYKHHLDMQQHQRAAGAMRETSLGRLLAYLMKRETRLIQTMALCEWIRQFNADRGFIELAENTYRETLDRYAQNVRQISRSLRREGVEVIAVGLASNFLTVHCTSLHGVNISPPDLERFDGLSFRGSQAYKSGDWGEAKRLFREAATLDPQFAAAAYWMGMSLRKQYLYDEAYQWLEKARNLFYLQEESDENYSRAPQGYNDALAKICRDENMPCFFLEKEFAQFSPDRIPGDKLFTDDLHFNEVGGDIFAELIWKKLTALPN